MKCFMSLEDSSIKNFNNLPHDEGLFNWVKIGGIVKFLDLPLFWRVSFNFESLLSSSLEELSVLFEIM